MKAFRDTFMIKCGVVNSHGELSRIGIKDKIRRVPSRLDIPTALSEKPFR